MVFNAAMKVVTELGEERRCMSCGEFWPADTEFFDLKRSSRDGLSMRCIACIRARVWALFRPPRSAAGERGRSSAFEDEALVAITPFLEK